MIVEDLNKHSDWVKMWSAKGSLHFDSHLGEIWTRRKNISNQTMYKQVVFIYKNGITDCWATKSDRDDLGSRLSSLAREDKNYATKMADDLKFCAKDVSSFISSHKVDEIGYAEFDEFWNLVYDYYLPHVSVKYIVDYVSPEELEIILPVLEKARLETEPIYRNIEDYVERIAEHIAKGTSYTKQMILATTKDELRSHLQNKKLPDSVQLMERYNASAMIIDDTDAYISTGKEVDEVERVMLSSAELNIIEGQSVYKGKVSGRVKIVLDPSDPKLSFLEGDILVTGMTRPEFLPLMEKSAAIITDSGGILSHAAITARELKKPCVIGTKIATKMLKDGDMVEVDANAGIVKLLSK